MTRPPRRRRSARRPPLAAALFAAAAGAACGGDIEEEKTGAAAVRPLLDRYCVDCHGEYYAENEFRLDAGALDLSGELSGESVAALVKVHDRLRAGEMPPADAAAPSAADRGHAVAGLAAALHAADLDRQRRDGRTRLRRLTRGEYEHAVRDLLDVDLPLKPMLPGDAVAHGFDRTVDALGTSSVLVGAYLDAATAAVDAAAVLGPEPEATVERHSYLTHDRYARLREPDSKIFLPLDDALAVFAGEKYCPTELSSFHADRPGRYRVRVSAYAFHHGDGPPGPVVFRAYAGSFGRGKDVGLVGHFVASPKPADAGDDWEPAPVEFETTLPDHGTFKFVPHDVGHRIWREGARESTERALAIRWVEVEGPLVEQWPPASYRALFGDLPTRLINAEAVAKNEWAKPQSEVVSADPTGDVRRLTEALATRAFRRPLEAGELDDLFALLDARLAVGESFTEVVKLGAVGVLCDPAFLTVGAEGPRPGGTPDPAGRLGPHALASRLSFFLHSSVPDEPLRAAAADGSIADPVVFRSHAERLLEDPKHARFTADFLDQWLDLAWIDASTPDPHLAPEYDEALRPAMVEETRRTFEYMLREDRPVREVADADWAILNARLARHYGLDPDALGLPPVGYEKVTLPSTGPGSERGGFVTQASVAKVTANGTHTSPVLRGQFVMDAILGRPIPPPPPAVPAIEPDVRGAETLRQTLEKHRADPACATCHRKMDPAGFALESLDVVGTFRTRYRTPKGDGDRRTVRVGNREITLWESLPVDPADALPDGRAFADLKEFKALLASDERQLARSLVEKWLVYGTGEGGTFADRKAVDAILDEAEPSGYGLRTLLLATVCSDAFGRR